MIVRYEEESWLRQALVKLNEKQRTAAFNTKEGVLRLCITQLTSRFTIEEGHKSRNVASNRSEFVRSKALQVNL